MSCDALHDIQLEIEHVQNSNSYVFARRINEGNYTQKAPKLSIYLHEIKGGTHSNM
jgi:hypothetical protein